MPRARNLVASRRKRKKILKAARGYWGGRHRLLCAARETVERARVFSYRDRRRRKRDFRRLWITRINAAAREQGLTYSQLMYGLTQAGIALDRKILADLAVHDRAAFAELVQAAKTH